ncbi:hypothetical protein M7I_7018 [Glarea lozoyensis 74030]|uniref:Uncharacterized protein n=1 Tax=Glarea lozoyensis (strain ATCC 74030 / MF5533) TaxID=1104152 RepID=H0EW58_GLAL7|nr:hypothetical protein M7I_7018 [Glarea lozoyensis 74030]
MLVTIPGSEKRAAQHIYVYIPQIKQVSKVVTQESVPSTTVIYQFPKSPTWIENLAILPNNQILLSLTTAPEVRLLDPNPPNPSIKLLHTFPYLSALGLVSLTPNLIYLILGNSTSTSFGAGTFAIWTLNPNTPATTTLLTTFPSAGLLNGLTLLCPSILALSDSTTGCIRLLNTYTNQSSILSRAPEMAPPTPFSIGINGLRTLVLGNRTPVPLRSSARRSLHACPGWGRRNPREERDG